MNRLSYFVGGLVFGGTVFLAVPFRMLSQNVEDLGDVWVLEQAALSGFLVFLAFYAGLFFLMRKTSFERTSRVLLVAGLFILFADVLSPLSIGRLITGAESPAEPVVGIIVEVFLLGVLIWLYRRPPKKVGYQIAWIFSLVFLGSELVAAYSAGLLGGQRSAQAAASVGESSTSQTGSIYHFIFDGFHGPWLEEALTDLGSGTDLGGFIHFRNARSNYLMTRASIPSFTTGRLYDGSSTVRHWLDETDDLSLLKRLRDRGYESTLYILNKRSGNRYADRQIIGEPVTTAYAADLWLLRLVPTALRREVFFDGQGIISRLMPDGQSNPTGDLRTVTSLSQYMRMLEDGEVGRTGGEYVFMHLNLPHAPYHLDRNFKYNPKDSDFQEQMVLSVKLMGMFIDTLKKQGRFDSSLIIFQSDHGSWSGGAKQARNDPTRNYLTIDDDLAAKIEKVDARRNDGWKVDARSRALLLIKPPGEAADRSLRVSDELMQLADVPQIALSVIDRSEDWKDADIVGDLERQFGKESVSVFHGMVLQIDEDGRELKVGQDITSGTLNHYTVFNDGRWLISEGVPFEW